MDRHGTFEPPPINRLPPTAQETDTTTVLTWYTSFTRRTKYVIARQWFGFLISRTVTSRVSLSSNVLTTIDRSVSTCCELAVRVWLKSSDADWALAAWKKVKVAPSISSIFQDTGNSMPPTVILVSPSMRTSLR